MRLAILDMYKGEPNQGMRNLDELIERYAEENETEIRKTVYDVRGKQELPGLDYDAYISTGGPGSPIDPEGWEEKYLSLINNIMVHNTTGTQKKHVLLICHSFQLFCFHYNLGKVCLRKSESFGTFPMHKTEAASHNAIMKDLKEPFYAVDSRRWQVIEPNYDALEKMGAEILALEKERPHVQLERATMAIQFTPEIFGTQFHPEADAQGMIFYLQQDEKKSVVVNNHGEEKYEQMLLHLNDPDKIMLTRHIIIPSFLDAAASMLNYQTVSR